MTAASEPKNMYSLMDRDLLAKMDGTVLTFGEVNKHREVLFKEDEVWPYRLDNLYPNVLYDSDARKFMGWCSPFLEWEAGKRGKRKTAIFRIESDNGVSWRRSQTPIEFENDGDSIFQPQGPHGAGVAKDKDGRLRMLVKTDGERRDGSRNRLYTSTSQDGQIWTEPILCEGEIPGGNTHHSFFWDESREKYVTHKRVIRDRIRTLALMESTNCEYWDCVKCLEWTPECADRCHQVYAMHATPYAQGYIGFAMILDDHVDDVSCELVFSRDLVRWRRVLPNVPVIRAGNGECDQHCFFAAAHPFVLGREMYLYYCASDTFHRSSKRTGALRLARLPSHKLAGVGAREPQKLGVVETESVPCDGTGLSLSADAACGNVVVAVIDKSEHEVFRSSPITSDLTDEPVFWEDGNDLTSLKGQEVRLRVEIADAIVYAFRFREEA